MGLLALAVMLSFFALTCEDEAEECDPANFQNYCESDEVICICDSETKSEKCNDCSEDCMEFEGQCVETENAKHKCECSAK
jgi:hypothetical protein